MRYPNIFVLILFILGVSFLVTIALFFLWPSPPPEPAPPPEETTVLMVEETTIIAEPTAPKEETTNQAQTEPTSAPKESTGGAGAACRAQAGNVLYAADWSSGMDGWLGSQDWQHTDSMLVSKGSPNAPREPILAPCQPPTQDYAIEAEIQLVKPQCEGRMEFGLVARATDNGGILGGFTCWPENHIAIASAEYGNFNFDRAPIASDPFTPGGGWHLYRLEVQSNTIRLFVDGAPVFEKTDNRQLQGSKVGLFDVNTQVNVKSFKVIKV